MNTRLTTVAGLAAATLLSGSAFAFAPSFNNDLFPTVHITDLVGSGPGAVFDGTNGPGATSNLFRYEDAPIDFSAYIGSLGNAADLSEIKVVTTEYDDTSDVTPNTVITLEIQGEESLTDVPDTSDFTDSTFTADTTTLDFRNIDFSPGSALDYPDAVGDATGWDLDASGPQERVVMFHIDTVDSTVPSGNSAKNMLVITSRDSEGDRTSTEGQASDPFMPSTPFPGAFEGWIQFSDRTILFIQTGTTNLTAAGNPGPDSPDTSGFAFTPSTTPSPAATPSLGLTSTVAQRGFAQWILTGLTYTKGNIYRVNLDVASNNPLGAAVYLQTGNPLTNGRAYTQYDANRGYVDDSGGKTLPALSGTAQEVRVYLAPKGNSTTADLTLQIVDEQPTTNTDVAGSFTVSEYSIDSATRAQVMGGATIVKNWGGTVPALAASDTTDGFSAPADTNLEAFVSGTGIGQLILGVALNPSLTKSFTINSGKVVMQFGPSANNVWDFARNAFGSTNTLNVDTIDTGIALNPANLYVLDVYASTNNPSAAHPALVVSTALDVSSSVISSWANLNVPADGGLENAPKVYTAVIDPSVSPNSSVAASISFGLIHTTANSPLANTTITVHRMVLYQTQVAP